ncbi:MAG: transposase [Rhodocyclales bacterium]|nr:transposase [Rhodocyclales bacterium]
MLDTMTTEKKRIRRNHSAALKAQIVAECDAAGASVAKVAMAHGINANIVHGWRKLARAQGVAAVATTEAVATPSFVPLAVEADPGADDCIHVEVRRGSLTMTITWPRSAAVEMAIWSRELLR